MGKYPYQVPDDVIIDDEIEDTEDVDRYDEEEAGSDD